MNKELFDSIINSVNLAVKAAGELYLFAQKVIEDLGQSTEMTLEQDAELDRQIEQLSTLPFMQP